MQTLFISDLHLAPERPQIARQFFDFAQTLAAGAEALYVLGDLFEYWVGDDEIADPFNESVVQALERLSRSGVALYFMHGNRDLLVGPEFARRCGARLLDDPHALDLYGRRTLIMHGDTLCTDDVDYQRFRAFAHDAGNQARFLAQPLASRRAQARDLRSQSEQSKSKKDTEIMDVSQDAVTAVLRGHGYPSLIHGHTHRPARHLHTVDGHACERWVLGDWYERGNYLESTPDGTRYVVL
jgi:UDP-2,3-diacylglucosamine hydrolase